MEKEKSYNNGKLKYEGEYINDSRKGKGNEFYNNGKLKFEGEYLNDLRNGKRKEYYIKNKIKFEGEYLNWRTNNGNGFNESGNLIMNMDNRKIKEYYKIMAN